MENFKVQLLTQNCVDGKSDDGRVFCSHGKVLLMVNDMILSGENSGDRTVASSALRLMKSAIYEYDSKNDFELIPCCNYLRLFPITPNYITWDTVISNNKITLSNIQCSRNEKNGLKVINGRFEIKHIEYITQIINFASKVIEFYSSSLPRKFYDKFDEDEYELFWKEFNEYYQILKEK